jgi:hypothetical protein
MPGIEPGQRLREFRRLGAVSRGARHRGRRRRPLGPYRRQHFVPEVVAGEPRLGIARILDPVGQALRRRPVQQAGAGECEERSLVPAGAEDRIRRHAGEACHARPAQQLDQHRLDLVVRVVRGEQYFSGGQLPLQGRVADLPGPGLRALARGRARIHPAHLQRQLQRATARPALLDPALGIRVQSVVDVRRAQAARLEAVGKPGQCGQEHGGIEAAAESHAVAPIPRRTRQAVELPPQGFEAEIAQGRQFAGGPSALNPRGSARC